MSEATLCERGDRLNLSRARAEIYWFSNLFSCFAAACGACVIIGPVVHSFASLTSKMLRVTSYAVCAHGNLRQEFNYCEL